MVKKSKAKSVKSSAKAEKTVKYTCQACGMTVKVDKACSCDPCDISCCGQDMALVTTC